MLGLSYPTETVLSNKITNRTVLSVKNSPRKPLGRRPNLKSQMDWQHFDKWRYSSLGHAIKNIELLVLAVGGANVRTAPCRFLPA